MATTPVENERPEIVIPPNDPKTKIPDFPGVFRKNNRKPVSSTNTGGFNNAKPASMLEEGWKIFGYPKINQSGLLVIKDGPEILVTVEKGMYLKDGKYIFTFKNLTNDQIFDIPYVEKWDFYMKTTPVPFVHKKNRRSRKTRKKQKGGFYPSVYGGIAGAKMLTPLIARQMMRMYETRKMRKRKSKKLSRNKRA